MEISAIFEVDCSELTQNESTTMNIYLTSERQTAKNESIVCGSNVTFTDLHSNTPYQAEIRLTTDFAECSVYTSKIMTIEGIITYHNLISVVLLEIVIIIMEFTVNTI